MKGILRFDDTNQWHVVELTKIDHDLRTCVAAIMQGEDLPHGMPEVLRVWDNYQLLIGSMPVNTKRVHALQASIADLYNAFRCATEDALRDRTDPYPTPIRDREFQKYVGMGCIPMYRTAGPEEFSVRLELELRRAIQDLPSQPSEDMLADILEMHSILPPRVILPDIAGIHRPAVHEYRKHKAEIEGTYSKRFVLEGLLGKEDTNLSALRRTDTPKARKYG